jgi:hypothetical protein
VLLALVTTACLTGERPTLGEPVALGGPTGTPTGNVAVDTVLQQLERTDHPSFTAGYDITRKLGPNSTDGVVVQDEDDTSITVGDVRFLQGTESSTCDLSEQTCEEGTLDARISDYSVSSGFYADAPARALRIAFERRSGEPTATVSADELTRKACPRVPQSNRLGKSVQSLRNSFVDFGTFAVNHRALSAAAADCPGRHDSGTGSR